ncbi:aldo/keto reductase [Alteromonas oceanisediminis]|uniref:aldo/keto reductase n=1 Tax=Alteromonas oceanisediminis TaxID=2836180 RepID=UPI001BDB2480|nr:aldo/keto reductase [Alteromonas oceanisediminis]MBT0586978.1 aldo/keto reductase [Alteromonas oceanisediminis]
MSPDKLSPLNRAFPNASRIIYGCMGLGGGWNNEAITAADEAQAHQVIESALDNRITVFDHADIYTFGKAEQVFGQVIRQNPSLRERMVIQTKCAIRFADEDGPKRYDFSAAWLQHSVEKSLKQLNVERLDVLLLHRPDPLMHLDETAATLNAMIKAGKIDQIGVSNMHSRHIAWLQSALQQPIVANQIEMSLAHCPLLEDSMTSGSTNALGASIDTGLLEYCQLNQIQIQAWGSLAQGNITSAKPQATAQHQRIYACVRQLAAEYQTTSEAIALAWLMRLPMNIQPIIGTTNTKRIASCTKAEQLTLTREHWYQLFEASRGTEVP